MDQGGVELQDRILIPEREPQQFNLPGLYAAQVVCVGILFPPSDKRAGASMSNPLKHGLDMVDCPRGGIDDENGCLKL